MRVQADHARPRSRSGVLEYCSRERREVQDGATRFVPAAARIPRSTGVARVNALESSPMLAADGGQRDATRLPDDGRDPRVASQIASRPAVVSASKYSARRPFDGGVKPRRTEMPALARETMGFGEQRLRAGRQVAPDRDAGGTGDGRACREVWRRRSNSRRRMDCADSAAREARARAANPRWPRSNCTRSTRELRRSLPLTQG